MSTAFEGIHLPVPTPFAKAGGVALSAWAELLAGLTTHPVAGIVVAGSTGEAPLLDEDELLALVDSARPLLESGTLTVGTGAESTRAALRLTRAVAARGADRVLVRAPTYYRPAMSDAALERHFLTLADEGGLPVLLYHIPKFVPVELNPDLVARLAAHERIMGIKDSSGDMTNLAALVDACGGSAAVLVGSGARLLDALELGAVGGILGAAVVAPAMACGVQSAYRAGDLDRARELQTRLALLHTIVVAQRGVPGVKYALDRLGLPGGPPRPPLRPLDEAGRLAVDRALAEAGLTS